MISYLQSGRTLPHILWHSTWGRRQALQIRSLEYQAVERDTAAELYLGTAPDTAAELHLATVLDTQ